MFFFLLFVRITPKTIDIMIEQIIKLFFSCYTMLLIIRIISFWIPEFRYHHFMRFIAHYTDPYLNIFRNIIPPIGGMLDISPMIAFLVWSSLEKIILSIVR